MENPSMIKNSVILVPFPFDDFSLIKVRPALCLTTEIGEHKHVVIAFISSKIPNKILESDLVLEKNSKLFQETGLAVESVIRLHKLVTIPKSLIKRKLGRIDIQTEKEVKEKIIKLFFEN
ncbi:MAG: type II toxin-antitoxin system PemK/MazF family toxin [Bacteroidales bacterium]|nr:type II toxin-antitoxin system PemK/MazF family toxin [Bacteroidales bacterium]